MRFLTLTTLLAAGLALSIPAQAAPTIDIAYPKDKVHLGYSHVILEGHVTPGAALNINGKAVNVGADGLFMEWWPLHGGLNTLRLQAMQGGQKATQPLNITYDLPVTLPAKPTLIARQSVRPGGTIDLYTAAGQTRNVQVRFLGSPGGHARATVGNLSVTLSEEARTPTQGAGWYSGALSLPTGEYRALPLKVTLTGKDGKTVSQVAALVSSSNQVRVAQVTAPDIGQGVNPATTSFDTGPNASDQLFPRLGERLEVQRVDAGGVTVQGISGSALAPTQALALLPAGTPLPRAVVGTPQVSETPTSWVIRWPVGERVLFDLIEKHVGGRAALSLALAGHNAGNSGTLDTLQLQQSLPMLRWNPQELSATLPQTQLWGYNAHYEDGPSGAELVLSLRKAPMLNPAQPMQGRIILIDPGHGGDETGGAGSLGVPEKNIVLPIAMRVVELLRAQGADARLTRNSDVKVPLYDRTLLAEQLGADMLVSIHANALPDGIDPRTHKGLEIHTYHPMTFELVQSLLNSIPQQVSGLNISSSSSTERDPSRSPGLMVSNLALTRPSTQRSILIETAYLTDPSDLRLLMNPATREGFAQGIAQGIANDYRAQAAEQSGPQNVQQSSQQNNQPPLGVPSYSAPAHPMQPAPAPAAPPLIPTPPVGTPLPSDNVPNDNVPPPGT